MAKKVRCPLCGKELELVPHPTKADRLVAYCTCRGQKVGVVEQPATHSVRKPFESSKESEE